ncbi:hypothetical protein BMF94_3615 [Rhodotorula taiwanensis]|uniref:Bifunctional lycopene cyclase/phytoene synthase n=1 Tax=Rhodotorula taiwanensis TaxID=741276 RepID=A0A2S5B989_9BASI|nr:hypothetical protein BMF94_3615 [Rhodotorula taiwanensis]
MGYDYWNVHLRWTIPQAVVLWSFLRKLRTPRDVYKTCFLIVATIPWDSYLIRNRASRFARHRDVLTIWSYPASSVVGPTLFAIPYEEVFFFFVQTYITATLYAVFSRPVVHAVLLPTKPSEGRLVRLAGVAVFGGIFALAWNKLAEGGEGTYLALIVAWVAPFLTLLWFIASSHIVAMPWSAVLPSIFAPTLYLWECDARALQRGTWVIEKGTKLGWSFRDLEIEEAVFFLLTNVMIVFGMIACDYCLAVHDIRSYGKRSSSFLPILLWMPKPEEAEIIRDLRNAIDILSAHSKSFSTASMVFDGRLRLDLLALYAWCRVCDDLIDNASSVSTAEQNIALITSCLDLLYPPGKADRDAHPRDIASSEIDLILSGLSEPERGSFRLLSLLPVTRPPLDELVDGFRTDLAFLANAPPTQNGHSTQAPATAKQDLPIRTDADLLVYANNVASSVADLCVQLVWAHSASPHPSSSDQKEILAAAREMGQALQLVNIARDVPADLKIGRMYLPARRLDEPVETFTEDRRELLRRARGMASRSKEAIEKLPKEARGGIRAACLVYLTIGGAVDMALDEGRIHDRATVRRGERARTAWGAL